MTVSAQSPPVSHFHTRWRARVAAWLAVLALVPLAGCSALKLGYQQGDRLVYWWVDRHVDVSAAQDPLTREAIARFFAWHRKTQLPEIAVVLARVRSEVQQPVSEEAVRQAQADSQRLIRQAYDSAVPDVADLMLTLTPAQIGHMQAKFAESNARYRKQYLLGDAESRESARFDKIMNYARLVYGRFSGDQEKAIRAAMGPLMEQAEWRYGERVRRQQEWLALARQAEASRPPKAELMAMLRRFADHWVKPPDHDSAEHYEARDRAAVALTVTIANLTTPEQKAHAVKRFQGWIDDTQALMHETPAGAAQAAN